MHRWKATCRKFTIIRNATSTFGKVTLQHTSCTTLPPPQKTLSHSVWPAVDDIMHRAFSPPIPEIKLFIAFHPFNEHNSSSSKAFSLTLLLAAIPVLLFWRRSCGLLCAFVFSSSVATRADFSFIWSQWYFLLQHTLADEFACVPTREKKKLLDLAQSRSPSFWAGLLALLIHSWLSSSTFHPTALQMIPLHSRLWAAAAEDSAAQLQPSWDNTTGKKK